jgi:hypothetical protein
MENAAPTYKGGIGFCPNLASCDNTDDLLAIDPRPGNATSNDAADNIALLDQAVARIPGRYRRRMLIRLDGAEFSHELLEHIAAGGKATGRNWEFSAASQLTFISALAVADDRSVRRIGPVIRAGESGPGDEFGPATRNINSAMLKGTTVVTSEYVVYAENYTAEQLGGHNPAMPVSVRYNLRGGQWAAS